MIKGLIKLIIKAVCKIRDEIAWARIRVDFRNRKGWAR